MTKRGTKTAGREDFQLRVILAMAEEMKSAKESMERSYTTFTVLAKSMGVEVVFD